MFESFKNIVLICVKGTLDLFLGSTTALLIQNLFPPVEKDENFWKLSLEIFLQTSLTLLIGIESRNLFFSEQDTLGPPFGITFILSLFTQKGFWDKVHLWQSSVADLVFEKSEPSA